MAADLEFACKAGTAGMQMAMGLVDSDMIKYGMAIGSDTSQGRPGDALEYTASAGGAAFIIGKEKKADHRRDTEDGELHHRHARLLEEGGGGLPIARRKVHWRARILQARHQRNEDASRGDGIKARGLQLCRVPPAERQVPDDRREAAWIHGKQIENGLLTPIIGNTYSGASLLGLAATLDIAKPGRG